MPSRLPVLVKQDACGLAHVTLVTGRAAIASIAKGRERRRGRVHGRCYLVKEMMRVGNLRIDLDVPKDV
jgi:hypothetical protein